MRIRQRKILSSKLLQFLNLKRLSNVFVIHKKAVKHKKQIVHGCVVNIVKRKWDLIKFVEITVSAVEYLHELSV